MTERHGVVLPLFAIMVLMMIIIFGSALDVSRSVSSREKLSYALDAAGLSVAAQLSTTVMTDAEIMEALSDSFEANLGDAAFLDDALENLEFEVDSENGVIKVTSSASVENYFMDWGGYSQQSFAPEFTTIGTNSQVTYSRFNVELALVVDVTGSMSNSDMKTLREASTSVVEILLPEDTDESEAKVRISLVPYSQGVNLGPYAKKVKGNEYGYSDSSKCVTERQDYDDGDDVYEVKYTDASYDYYDANYPPPMGTFYGGGSNNCSKDSEMIPLTSDRDDLLDAIDDLDDNGGTAGQTGITWGWNTLSPNYSDVWPSDSKPEPYENDDVLKFAIIMTDGNNNQYYKFTETKDVCTKKKWNGSCKKWQTVVVNEWDEVNESESYSNKSSKSSRALCAAMKSAGIEIFGVYFGSNNNSTGAKNMQSCASDGNYYRASSSSDLINSFANIARKIQKIYLSQ